MMVFLNYQIALLTTITHQEMAEENHHINIFHHRYKIAILLTTI